MEGDVKDVCQIVTVGNQIWNQDGWLMDLDAGVPGSGAAVIINPAQIYTGGTVRLAQLRLQEP